VRRSDKALLRLAARAIALHYTEPVRQAMVRWRKVIAAAKIAAQ
jgi:hypothetical protein